MNMSTLKAAVTDLPFTPHKEASNNKSILLQLLDYSYKLYF